MTTRLDERHEAATPCCGKKLDGSTCADGEDVVPTPGDVSVCAYCSSWLVYEKGPRVRLMEQAEIDALDRQTRDALWRATQFVEQARAEHGVRI